MNNVEYRELRLFALISLILFIAVVIVAPIAGEDYGLTKHFTTENIFARISYAIDKSHIQIITWNARLGEQLSIFELSLPRWISLLIYSLSFVFFSATVGMLSSKNDGSKWKIVSAYVAGLTFLLWPGMEVFFWKTANSGYLQTMILTMLVAIPYAGEYNIEHMKKRRLKYSAYLIICLLAGLSFENVPFALAISLLSLCLWQKRKSLLNYIPIIVLLLGWILLISTKSTLIRREYYLHAYPHNINPLIHYTERFKDVVSVFLETSSVILTLSIISLCYLKKLGLMTKYHICLIMASILVVGSMLASPYTEARSFLFAWCAMFSIICYAFSEAVERYQIRSISTILLMASFCFGVYTLIIYSSYGEKLAQRDKAILNSIGKEACIKGYPIKLIMDKHSYRYLNNRDEWYFYNASTIGSNYYNCKLVTEF